MLVQALYLKGKKYVLCLFHNRHLMKLNHQVMMVSGGITGFGSSEYYTDTSEIWTGSAWRFTTGKLPYTARDVRMAFIDNRILYLGIKALNMFKLDKNNNVYLYVVCS